MKTAFHEESSCQTCDMKRAILYLLALLLLSCQKESPQQVSISLSVSGQDPTKVSLDDDLRTSWNKGDKATVFYKSTTATEWQYDGNDGAREGLLKYTGSPLKESASESYAVCPSDLSASLTGTVMSLNFPSEQVLEGSRNVAPVLVSRSSSSDLVFSYATSLVSFSLKGFGQVEDIVFQGNDGEVLCGEAVVDMSQAQPALILGQGASGKELTMKRPGDVPLADLSEETGEFYISLPQITLQKGFTIYVNYVRGNTQLIKYTDSITLTAGEVTPLGEIRAEETFTVEIDFNQGYGVGKSNIANALADFKSEYGVTLPTATGTGSAVYDMLVDGEEYRFEFGYCNGTTPGNFYLTANDDAIAPCLAMSTNGWYVKLPKVENHLLIGFSNVAGRTITTTSSTEYFITTDVSVSRSDARSKCVSNKLYAPQEVGQEYYAYIDIPSADEDYYICLYAGGWLYMQNLKLYYRRIR